jgi:hypothetical protein
MDIAEQYIGAAGALVVALVTYGEQGGADAWPVSIRQEIYSKPLVYTMRNIVQRI